MNRLFHLGLPAAIVLVLDNYRTEPTIGRAKNSARPTFPSALSSPAPVLSRGRLVWHLFEIVQNPTSCTGNMIGRKHATKRLKTGAITLGSSQAIGAPSFSPYRLCVRIPQSPRLSAIGYRLFGASFRRVSDCLPESQIQPEPPSQRMLTICKRINSMES